MAEHHWSERAGRQERYGRAELPRKGGRCDEALDGNAVMDRIHLEMADHRLRGLPGSRDRRMQFGIQFKFQQQPAGHLSAGDHRGAIDLSSGGQHESGHGDLVRRGD
jgi:hypothetical protein